ncbi:MAG TPA: O-antigen ligase family protein [Gaiellaceae bacterium]|nr:O-antigen ligase family protein [Gaiellaceae bacterium]
MTALPPSGRVALGGKARRLVRETTGGALVLAAAVPLLFLHIRYQPKVSVGVGSTSAELTLADAAIAAVVLAAALRARRDGLAALAPARWILLATGLLLALALLALATPSLLGEEYPLAVHAVSALKFCWYALLLPATLVLVRTRDDARVLFIAVVLWSAVATAWGALQFLGLVSEFEGRRPGQREPSFVGIHDLSALSGAALALGLAGLALVRERPLARSWTGPALAAGALGVVLSGAMTGVAGVWLATLAILGLARARGLLATRGALAALAIVLAVTAGTAVMRAEAIERFAEFIGLRDPQEEVRAESYPQRTMLAYIGLRIWLDHPVAGVGWLASDEEWAYGPHLDDARRRFPNLPDESFPSPEHPWGVQSLYVQALADLGLIGFAALLALGAAALTAGLRAARASPVALVGLAWMLVAAGVWAGLGLVSGIPLAALTWLALGLVTSRA